MLLGGSWQLIKAITDAEQPCIVPVIGTTKLLLGYRDTANSDRLTAREIELTTGAAGTKHTLSAGAISYLACTSLNGDAEPEGWPAFAFSDAADGDKLSVRYTDSADFSSWPSDFLSMSTGENAAADTSHMHHCQHHTLSCSHDLTLSLPRCHSVTR